MLYLIEKHLVSRSDMKNDLSEGEMGFQFCKHDFDVTNMHCREIKPLLLHYCTYICLIWSVSTDCLWYN